MSGQCIAMMLQPRVANDDPNYAVDTARAIIGAEGRLPGTIRGDMATSIRHNIIHASDSKEAAAKEYQYFLR